MHEDNRLIEGLVNNQRPILEEIYQTYQPKIIRFVQSNSGSRMEGEDLFQEALMVLFYKSRQADFQLTSSFYSLFYGICRNLWLKKLRKKSRKEVTLSDDFEYKDEQDIEQQIFLRERRNLITEKWKQMTGRCQKIMHLFYQERKKMAEIATVMGFANENVAKKEKSKCKKKLTTLIQEDSRFDDLQWD